MADMTATAAESAAAGAAAFTLALVGLHPVALFCGLVGAGFGISATKPDGKWRTMSVFLFAMFGGAYFGTWAASYFFHDGPMARNALALILSAIASPALSAITAQLEPIARGWADKFGARR